MASRPPAPDARPSARRLLSRRERERRRQRLVLLLSAAAVLLVLAIPIAGYIVNFVLPPRRVVVRVNEVTFTLGDLVKVMRMLQAGNRMLGAPFNLGTAPFSVVQALVDNELIRQAAPRYNIVVTEEEVDREIRRRIVGEPGPDGTPSPEEERAFREAYRQYLSLIQMSDAEYRRIVRYDLYREKMLEVLGQEVPTVAPQVHLYLIAVPDSETAREVQDRFRRGIPFDELAREFSTDPSREDGGDIGWFPQGVLPEEVDSRVFRLEVNEISEPIPRPDGTFALYYLAERADARPVEEEHREVLKARALEQWLQEERSRQEVEVRLDSDTYAWLIRQLRLSDPGALPGSPG